MVHGSAKISKATILQSFINRKPIKLSKDSAYLFNFHHAHREINQHPISPGPVNEQPFQPNRRRVHKQQKDHFI